MTASRLSTELIAGLADRYRLERELGAGGMATVYLAHDLKHDRDVAIKVLREDLAASLGKERFLREIQLAAKLSHPHILPLFDSGEVRGMLFYVMPNVSGQSLRDRLARDRMLPVAEAVRIAIEVAGALDHAHRHGVIHRDIKPENIMFQDGHALVADFGIGKAVSDVVGNTLTQMGTSVGTPAYMSPEQAVGDEVDGRTDIYSLGCVLYEMLAGEPPFTGPTVQAVIAKRFVQTPTDVAVLREGVPRTIARAVQKALARVPLDRYDTAALFIMACSEVDTAASQSAAPEKSIVVLPFENMSADRDTDYFADGISEEIINALTQCADLRVAARTSSFSFKGRHEDLRTIAAKLGVRHVLEGSVRKAGSRLRITAQLINAADGYHLWSERYDRDMDDIFAIQDEIATAIAAKLQVTLGATAGGQLVRPATADLEAYDQYLRGMTLMHRRGVGIMEAIDCFRRATEIDRHYVPALAGLAHSLALAAFWGIVSPDEVRDAARDAATRALEAGPALVEAQVASAMVAIAIDVDRTKAADAWRRAMALGPTDVNTRADYATFHLCYVCGDFDAAIRELRDALEIDPLSQLLHSQLGFVLTYAGRAGDGIVEARRAIELDPDVMFGYWVLLHGLVVSGKHDEAIAIGAKVTRRFGRNPWVLQGIAAAYAGAGRLDDASAIFDELVARSRTEHVQPLPLAAIAMSIGRRDEAVRRMAAAVAVRDSLLMPLLIHSPFPPFVALRREPEHAVVMRQLGWDVPLATAAPGQST